jgi:hypothetical protein
MSWTVYQPIGRVSSQWTGLFTSSLGGFPPDELDCIPAHREETFPMSWTIVILLGGKPPNKNFICVPIHQEIGVQANTPFNFGVLAGTPFLREVPI